MLLTLIEPRELRDMNKLVFCLVAILKFSACDVSEKRKKFIVEIRDISHKPRQIEIGNV